MKVMQINTVCNLSTGKIAVEISKLLCKEKNENYIFYTSGSSNYEFAKKYANDVQIKLNALKTKNLGNYGFNSKSITRKLISEIKRINPDIVQLHNLHGHNVNLEMLFNYLKSTDIKIFWTFHDCWSFTGYCTYFDYIGCNKWKTGCENCVQKQKFSWLFDRSKELYQKKKRLFSDLKNLTIITPSQWLANLVGESFFGSYPIYVINNGIDTDVFKPTQSEFREKYNIEDKKILLGVAATWSQRKGLDVFIELSKELDNSFQIVLVGLNEEQIKELPDNIFGIQRTNNQQELAEIYTSADVFVNPTKEDNFPTVNLEALACGTPVITFKTGGSEECIDENTGIVVEKDDIDGLIQQIQIINTNDYPSEICRQRVVELFNSDFCFNKYVELYKEVFGKE